MNTEQIAELQKKYNLQFTKSEKFTCKFNHFIDDTQYWNTGLHNSTLNYVEKGKFFFNAYQNGEIPKTKILEQGINIHFVVLQPNEYLSKLCVKIDERKKNAKQQNQENQEEGKILVSESDIKKYEQICNTLHKNNEIKNLFKNRIDIEQGICFEYGCKETELELVCVKPDLITQAEVWDLKTTQNANHKEFIYNAIKYGYDRQAAIYQQGVKVAYQKGVKQNLYTSVILAIETTPPYYYSIIEVSKSILKKGIEKFNTLFLKWQEYKKSYTGDKNTQEVERFIWEDIDI